MDGRYMQEPRQSCIDRHVWAKKSYTLYIFYKRLCEFNYFQLSCSVSEVHSQVEKYSKRIKRSKYVPLCPPRNHIKPGTDYETFVSQTHEMFQISCVSLFACT